MSPITTAGNADVVWFLPVSTPQAREGTTLSARIELLPHIYGISGARRQAIRKRQPVLTQ